MLAKMVLEQAGHRVRTVANGAEAVAAVRESAFDLVLMDVRMPEMDGLEATRRIRALPGEESDVPIIALTADSSPGDREEVLAAGMTNLIPKPFRPEDLLAGLARCHPDRAEDKPEPGDTAVAAAGCDEAVLAEVEEALGRARVAKLFRDLIRDCERKVADIKNGIEVGDAESAGNAAHNIKSLLGSYGFTGGQGFAAQIERACADQDWQTVQSAVPALADAMESARQFMAARYREPGQVADEETGSAGEAQREACSGVRRR